jgi:hypothetical protein
VRGGTAFGPPDAAALLRPVFAQFAEWSVCRVVSGADSTSSNNAGLPAIGLQQDPMEYNSMTQYTYLGAYERIVPEDVKEER